MPVFIRTLLCHTGVLRRSPDLRHLASTSTGRPAFSAVASCPPPLRPFRASSPAVPSPPPPAPTDSSAAPPPPLSLLLPSRRTFGGGPPSPPSSARDGRAEAPSATRPPDLAEHRHRVEVKMPHLDTDGSLEARVVEYYIAEGDVIERGKIMCDVEVKSMMVFSMDNDDEGYSVVEKIHVQENEKIPKAGAVLFTLLQKGEK